MIDGSSQSLASAISLGSSSRICHRGIAAEPIGHLLPEAAALAGRIQPGIVVLVETAAHFAHVADVALRLEFELPAEPSLGLDGPVGRRMNGLGSNGGRLPG